LAAGKFKEAQQLYGTALRSKLEGGWLPSHVSVARDHHGLGLCALALAQYACARAELRLAKETLLRAASEAETTESLSVDIALMQLALEVGALFPDARVSVRGSLDDVTKAEVIR